MTSKAQDWVNEVHKTRPKCVTPTGNTLAVVFALETGTPGVRLLRQDLSELEAVYFASWIRDVLNAKPEVSLAT